MQLRRRAVAAAALAVLAVAVPAHGAEARPPAGLLVVRGEGGTHVDVTFRRAMAFDRHPWPWGLTWSGCGRYAGYLIQPLGVEYAAAFGHVEVAAFEWGTLTRSPTPLGAAGWGTVDGDPRARVTASSRYRVHLLGEGQCEVRVPVRGIGASRVAVRTGTARTPARFGYQEWNTTPDGLPRVAAGTSPVDVGPATVAVAVLHGLERDGMSGGSGGFLPVRPVECAEPEEPGAQWDYVEFASNSHYDAQTAANGFLPGRICPGRYYAYGELDSPIGMVYAGLATLAVDL